MRLACIIPRVERVAVIDMGSNSWRLVVFGYSPERPGGASSTRSARPSGSARGWGDEGVLRPDRVDRALHTAAVFSAFCRGHRRRGGGGGRHQRDPRRHVTAAELLAEIKRSTGLEARVISGSEEARYGWLAMANSTTIEDGFGLDIGGGSIQGMRIEGRRLAEAQSLPLGAVRVSERFLPGEKATAKQMKALRAHVAGELEQLGWWMRRRSSGRHRRDDPQPRRRGDEAARHPGHRRPGVPAHARGARAADRGAGRAAGLEASPGEGHQVRPRRRDPGRRARARHCDRAGRVRLDRGDRGGAARRHLLRAAARRG